VLERATPAASRAIRVACPILPRIANFDDLDPLKAGSCVELVMVPPGQPIPGDCALIVLPGSKASLADMEGHTRARLGHRRDRPPPARRAILGICGGYQMLGQTLSDPHGIEGAPGAVPGLGLLDCTTVLTPRKALREVAGTAWGQPFTGFEMHMGETAGPDCARPLPARWRPPGWRHQPRWPGDRQLCPWRTRQHGPARGAARPARRPLGRARPCRPRRCRARCLAEPSNSMSISTRCSPSPIKG
jgi:hypothetical protein